MSNTQDPIIALATPSGISAIALIRLSGHGVIAMVNRVFHEKDLTKQPSHTVHFGTIRQGSQVMDEVLVTLFIAPHSFTKEESVEISCHGSPFIVNQLIQLFIVEGVRLAEPGEFTKRAFLNGRFDLTQAEAIADLIAADSALAHQIALKQMRGGFSSELQKLRNECIHLAAMLELELDFSEEDITFVDRANLAQLVETLLTTVDRLIESFQLGNVLKQGIAIAIVGEPNVGKSTLFNALLQEDRAIVSPIAGTTRDTIEGNLHLGGVLLRFVDTAGLRTTISDEIEAIGIARAKQQLHKALLVLYVADVACTTVSQAERTLISLGLEQLPLIKIGNKIDQASEVTLADFAANHYVLTAAQTNVGIDSLKTKLIRWVEETPIHNVGTIVVNARHYDRLLQSKQALESVKQGLSNHLSNELLAIDIRRMLHVLGEITGEITTEDMLGEIFSRFCIGK